MDTVMESNDNGGRKRFCSLHCTGRTLAGIHLVRKPGIHLVRKRGMHESFRQSDLEAYLDEALPPEEMASVEQTLRADAALGRRLAAVVAFRDAGIHSIGGIWRQHRLSCPTREQLGSYLLDVLPDDWAGYVAFHLEVVGCRFCRANLADLKRQEEESPSVVESRRRRYFQTSAGHLRRAP